MTVTYNVCRGINKLACEDSARIGGLTVNDKAGSVSIALPAVIALCDGVGGNAGGREASHFICSNMCQDLRGLNLRLIEYGKSIGKPLMATTLTALFFEDGKTSLAHAGNTRLYAYRGGFLEQITTDHTTYEWLKVRTDAAKLCNKSEIYCAFGGGNPAYIKSLSTETVFERRMPKMLMLTTDGVHDFVSSDEMEEILSLKLPMEDKARRITDLAAQNGSEDDRSVIILEM